MKSFHPWLVVKRLASGTALIAASLAITLLALEIGLRLWDGVAIFSMLNFVGLELDKLHRPGAAGGVDYDAYVGWTQAANLSTANFTTGEHGARMPSTKIVPLQRGAILMVGNSFGAGAEVSDAELWPAQLERRLGTQVINAAVGGYGFDQIILRAEMLLPLLKPRMLLVQTRLEYGNSVDRMSVAGGTPKPFFKIEDGKLALHNEPVPRIASSSHDLGWQRSVFGRSYLVQYAMTRLDLLQWWVTAMRIKYELSPSEALDVGCLLMRRLAEIRDRDGIRVGLVLQYSGPDGIENTLGWEHDRARLLDCAKHEGLEIVDTLYPLKAVRENRDLAAYQQLWVMHDNNRIYGHPSTEGNRLTANAIMQQLFPPGGIEAKSN